MSISVIFIGVCGIYPVIILVYRGKSATAPQIAVARARNSRTKVLLENGLVMTQEADVTGISF